MTFCIIIKWLSNTNSRLNIEVNATAFEMLLGQKKKKTYQSLLADVSRTLILLFIFGYNCSSCF